MTDFKHTFTAGFCNKFAASAAPSPSACYLLNYLAKLLLWTGSTFSKLLAMFVGVSKFGKTYLIFVNPRVKINGRYCRDSLLIEQLYSLSFIWQVYYIFQQVSMCTRTETFAPLIYYIYKCKKLRFRHELTASDTFKTAKITKWWLPISTLPKCQCAVE